MLVGIVGGGACGLSCATVLEKYKIDYLIFERSNKIGSKILASGNGRCNIFNKNLIDSKDFKYDLLLNFLKENECPLVVDDEGRYYPLSNSSKTILDLFLSKIDKNKLILNKPILKIEKINNKYKLADKLVDKLVLASGSVANIIKDKQDVVYSYLKSLNINLTKIKPSLCGFKTKEDTTLLKGLRIKGLVSLYNDNKLIVKEEGEINFKEDGLSGIVIMNMSYYYNKLKELKNPYLIIKIYPNYNLTNFKSLKYAIPTNLYNYINKYKLNIYDLKFHILSTYDYFNSQVISGGVDLNIIDWDFSLKKDKNIYIGGELLDYDFPCGGYNLSTAFSCGFMIGQNIYEKYQKCN